MREEKTCNNLPEFLSAAVEWEDQIKDLMEGRRVEA